MKAKSSRGSINVGSCNVAHFTKQMSVKSLGNVSYIRYLFFVIQNGQVHLKLHRVLAMRCRNAYLR